MPKEQWREGDVPRRARTRRHQQPAAVLSWPMWKRALCFLLFVVGGGGAAAWGVYGLVAWIGALKRGDGMIGTESFVLGFPLLGAGLCAIGAEFIAPRWVAAWSDAGKARFAAVALGSIGAGILFVFLGQLVINVAMEVEGYHACQVGGRGRVTDVILGPCGRGLPRQGHRPMTRRPNAAIAAIVGLLVAAASPFVVLFPDPPAFGPQSLLLVATFAIVATLATARRTEPGGRRRILRRAGALFGVTAATTGSSMALHGGIPVVPTPDLFGLRGEDIDGAILFEAWCEIWLGWALVAVLLAWCLPRRPAPVPLATSPWHRKVQRQPWNAATVLLFVVGWCAMAGAVAEGHRTAAFLARADHVAGTIANDDAHPLIRFATGDGTAVTFRQNGGIARAVEEAVPVAYDPTDPAGTARADTLFAAWGEVMGLAWIGLGFTLFPFFGVRAAFGRR